MWNTSRKPSLQDDSNEEHWTKHVLQAGLDPEEDDNPSVAHPSADVDKDKLSVAHPSTDVDVWDRMKQHVLYDKDYVVELKSRYGMLRHEVVGNEARGDGFTMSIEYTVTVIMLAIL